MSQTVFASFADIAMAEKAAGALLDYGVLKEDISIVAGNAKPLQSVSSTIDTTPVYESNVSGVYDTTLPTGAYAAGTAPGIDTIQSVREPTTDPSDRWPASASNQNRTEPMMRDATFGVSQNLDPEDREAIHRGEDEGLIGEDDRLIIANANDRGSTVPVTGTGTGYNTVSTTAYVNRESDRIPTDKDYERAEGAAKGGISTTTAADAGQGAIEGAGWGLGVGILAGLAALMVPGVGLVFGAGALATAIGGAALTTAGGAIAGGVTGYLKDMGVPETAATQYQQNISLGQALVAVTLPSGDVDMATGQSVLEKYGASNISLF